VRKVSVICHLATDSFKPTTRHYQLMTGWRLSLRR